MEKVIVLSTDIADIEVKDGVLYMRFRVENIRLCQKIRIECLV